METSGFSTMKFPSVLQNEMVLYGINLWSPVNKTQVKHSVLIHIFWTEKFKTVHS